MGSVDAIDVDMDIPSTEELSFAQRLALRIQGEKDIRTLAKDLVAIIQEHQFNLWNPKKSGLTLSPEEHQKLHHQAFELFHALSPIAAGGHTHYYSSPLAKEARDIRMSCGDHPLSAEDIHKECEKLAQWLEEHPAPQEEQDSWPLAGRLRGCLERAEELNFFTRIEARAMDCTR